MGSPDGSFDSSDKSKSNDSLLGASFGEEVSTKFGSPDDANEGNALGVLDGSFDGSNEGKSEGYFLVASLGEEVVTAIGSPDGPEVLRKDMRWVF